MSLLFLAEQALYMERDGVIHQVSYKEFLGAALAVAATPGGRILWSEIRNVIGDDIAKYIDDEFERRAPDAPDWLTLLPHWEMLLWGVRRRRSREVIGQALRIVGAATKTEFGLVPAGNTGGSNLSPFRSLPVALELQEIIDEARSERPWVKIPTDVLVYEERPDDLALVRAWKSRGDAEC